MSADSLRAQSFRRRVRIERKVATRDEIGGEDISYSPRTELYADVRPVSGREPFLAQQFQVGEAYEFRVRYRTDIEPTDRVVWKQEIYDITAVLEIGRNRGLRIIAKRPGADAT
jgi:SPP1 family predicted phage head-tail adaptor